jgi:LmbE family N-acetylglucosaminyl deacetylase
MKQKSALAIGAHPDDIEFFMAGTLLMLRNAGFEIHYLNIANGNCGSTQFRAAQLARMRRAEARAAARVLGACYHESMVSDLEILYTTDLLRRVAAVIRVAEPNILLTHSPQDYMEDHMTACRLAVTAAFTREMPNFKTRPARSPVNTPVTLYHAMPHGLCDPLRKRVKAGVFVNTTPVHHIKHEALVMHKSQQQWLETSQGTNSYLKAMDSMSLEVGRMSRKFKHAEGWRRHLHLGYCGPNDDPLVEALGKDCLLNRAYEKSLED